MSLHGDISVNHQRIGWWDAQRITTDPDGQHTYRWRASADHGELTGVLRSNTREEDLARLVTKTLDAWREEFGFALILEHHSPHGSGEGQRSVRPIGSSLWLRWPEFGMGIRPQSGTKVSDRAGELAPWRGSRDERPWPTLLETGGPGSLPWIDPHLMHPQARRTA